MSAFDRRVSTRIPLSPVATDAATPIRRFSEWHGASVELRQDSLILRHNVSFFLGARRCVSLEDLRYADLVGLAIRPFKDRSAHMRSLAAVGLSGTLEISSQLTIETRQSTRLFGCRVHPIDLAARIESVSGVSPDRGHGQFRWSEFS